MAGPSWDESWLASSNNLRDSSSVGCGAINKYKWTQNMAHDLSALPVLCCPNCLLPLQSAHDHQTHLINLHTHMYINLWHYEYEYDCYIFICMNWMQRGTVPDCQGALNKDQPVFSFILFLLAFFWVSPISKVRYLVLLFLRVPITCDHLLISPMVWPINHLFHICVYNYAFDFQVCTHIGNLLQTL